MKTIESTSKQRSMIGFLINKLKIDPETKEEIIWQFSSGRGVSIKDLQFNEASAVIKALITGQVELKDPAEQMRRKLLSMAHEVGWELPNGKVDMERVNNWCVQFGFLHKKLNDYNANELPRLITAFEAMYVKHLKGV